jgi:hypothetical protein
MPQGWLGCALGGFARIEHQEASGAFSHSSEERWACYVLDNRSVKRLLWVRI